jgi:acylpyruvate hydrolase
VLRPRGVRLHYEVELGLVIGRTVRDLNPEDDTGAIDAIASACASFLELKTRLTVAAGYILAIDMTARNVQDEAKRKSLPWTTAKGFDTFLPVSHPIAKSRIPDPHDAFLRLSVSGALRQADSTSLMLYRIPRQLADISRVMTLEPGDLVLTGTPKGVGEVEAGDVMTATIEVASGNGIDRGGQMAVLNEGTIQVEVQDRVDGRFVFKET